MDDNTLTGYVINLDRRAERYSTFCKEFEGVDLKIQRVPATDGQQVDISEYYDHLNPWYKIFGSERVIKSTIGCKLSHEKLWARISNYPDGLYCIFEDDARILGSIKKINLNKILEMAPRDADLIWLNEFSVTQSLTLRSRVPNFLNRISGNSGLGSKALSLLEDNARKNERYKFSPWFPIGAKTTEAYAIRPSFARKLLDYTNQWTDSIDAQMRSAAEHIKCSIFCVAPPLFTQDVNLVSDIQAPREKI